MSEVLDYLATKGYLQKKTIGKEAEFSCFFCDEPPHKRGRLYVNTDDVAGTDGIYFCHLCGASGNIITLKKYFGDPVSDHEETDYRRFDILNAVANYYHELLSEYPEHLQYLKNRGLTVQTIMEQKLGYCDGSFSETGKFTIDDLETAKIYGPAGERLKGCITIPYIVAGSVVQIRGRNMHGTGSDDRYFTLPGDKNRLFNVDACWKGKDKIVVCEGEFDTIAAKQLGFSAVGLVGAGNWQKSWNDYFTSFRRIYTAFDNDEAGVKGAQKVADALGPRVRILTLAGPQDPDKFDFSDWVAAGHTAEDLTDLMLQAGGGLLVNVDQAYEEWTELNQEKPQSLGFKALDESIEGGMRPGQVAIPLAGTGVGKTLFLLNIFHRLILQDPSQKILFVSLEQTAFEWFSRARKIYEFYNPGSTDKQMLDFYRENLLIVEKNRISEDEFLSTLDDFRDQLGGKPDLVAIDYLGYWTNSFKGEPYERVSRGVMTLKAIAKDQRICVVTPHQIARDKKDPDGFPSIHGARDSGVVEETADYIFVLKGTETVSQNTKFDTQKIHLKIGKSRHGGKGKPLDFLYAPLANALVDAYGDEYVLAERAKADSFYNSQFKPWEFAMQEHRTGDKEYRKAR